MQTQDSLIYSWLDVLFSLQIQCFQKHLVHTLHNWVRKKESEPFVSFKLTRSPSGGHQVSTP